MSDIRDALLFLDLDKGAEALGPLFEEPRQRLDREPALRAAWAQFQALRALAWECAPEPGEKLLRQALAQCRREAVKAQLARAAGSDDLAREILLGRVKERRGLPAWASLLMLAGALGLAWMAFGPQIQALSGLGALQPEATPTPTFPLQKPDEDLAFEFPEQTPPMEAALAAPEAGAPDDSDVKQEVPAARTARRLVREQMLAAAPTPRPSATPTALVMAPPTRPVPQVQFVEERPSATPARPQATAAPSRVPTAEPSLPPTPAPTTVPTAAPTELPTRVPMAQPTAQPTARPRPADPSSVSGPVPSEAGLALSANKVAPGKTVEVLLEMPARHEIDLRLFDQRGRPVRGVLDGAQGPGTLKLELTATDAEARPLLPGTYYLRVMTPWFSRVEPIEVQ